MELETVQIVFLQCNIKQHFNRRDALRDYHLRQYLSAEKLKISFAVEMGRTCAPTPGCMGTRAKCY